VVRRRVLGVFGILLAFVLPLGALLVGCAGPEEDSGQGAEPARELPEETAAPEETVAARQAVVRVSGTPGTAYSGTYATGGETQTVGDNTVETEPRDYPVEIGDDDTGLTAAFRKTRPGRETLKAEILVDGEVVTQSDTSAEFGSITLSYTPPEALPGQRTTDRTTLPGEFDKDRTTARTTLPGEP
jgi:hypothetical protein